MKVFSYTCPIDTVAEVRTTLVNLGANVFKQIQIADVESIPPVLHIKLVFMADKDTELLLKLKFPFGSLVDCTI